MRAQYINILTSAVMYFHVWRCMKQIQENHSFRLWVVVIHTDVRTTKHIDNLQMVNEKSIKIVFDRGIFWVHGISVSSRVSGDIQQRLCIFWMESLSTE